MLGYWRSHSEVGRVIVAAAIIAVAAAWLAVKGGNSANSELEQHRAEFRRLNNPRLYEPHCENPEDREEADLCTQREMAKAARDLYELTWWQIVLTAVGTGAVLASLKFTRDALHVAREAIQVEREMGERQLRAYVHAVKAELIMNALCQYEIEVTIRNVGQTSALEASLFVWPNAEPYGKSIEFQEVLVKPTLGRIDIIDPNTEITETRRLLRLPTTDSELQKRAGKSAMYTFRGYILYSDIFGKRFQTDFWFISSNIIADPGRLALIQVREGAPAYRDVTGDLKKKAAAKSI